MRRSFRNRSRDGLQSNPFVVLADVTIALAFIFAVHGLAAVTSNSQALQVAERLEKQNSLRDEVLSELMRIYPSTRIEHRRNPGDSQDHSLLISSDPEWGTKPIAEVWANGNFQRIILNAPVFRRGGDRLLPTGDRLYDALADPLKKNAPELSYLFVHGIVEPSETMSRGGPVSRTAALNVSRRRADDVYNRLERKKVISPTTDAEATTDSDGQPCVPAKYAISFGTGSDLYSRNTGVGRVDLLLFFK